MTTLRRDTLAKMEAAKGIVRRNGTAPEDDADLAGTVDLIMPPAWTPKVHLTADEIATVANTDSFIRRYRDYASLRTDAPAVFHEAVAYACMSASIGRTASLNLTVGRVHCNLWLMLVANSTTHRKSTALDLGDGLLRLAGLDVLAPDDFSPQRFVNLMAERPGRATLFRRDEFSGFYSQLSKLDHQTGGKQTLIKFYDGKDYEKQLVGDKVLKDGKPVRVAEKIVVTDPFLSIMAGTQFDSFLETAETGDIAGGFWPRFAFIVPAERPARKDVSMMTGDLDGMACDLAKELARIAARPARQMRVSVGVLARWNTYQAAVEDEAPEAPIPSVAEPVFSRSSFMALKVALLLAAADGDVIEMSHMLTGIAQAEQWRADSYRLLCQIGPTREEKAVSRVQDLVERKPGVMRGQVMAALRISARDMDALENTLAQRGAISVTSRGKGKVYQPRILENLNPCPVPFTENSQNKDYKPYKDYKDSGFLRRGEKKDTQQRFKDDKDSPAAGSTTPAPGQAGDGWDAPEGPAIGTVRPPTLAGMECPAHPFSDVVRTAEGWTCSICGMPAVPPSTRY